MKVTFLFLWLIAQFSFAGCSYLNPKTSTPLILITQIIGRITTPSPIPSRVPTSTQFLKKDLPIPDKEQAFLLTFTVTPTKTPTKTVTLTPSPVPTLEEHTWLSVNPFVILTSPGRGPNYPYPPDLILYSDGRLLIFHSQSEPYQIYSKQLARNEVCAYLNTIDQYGFFDYDASTYSIDRLGRQIKRFPVYDASTNIITVNAWRSKSVSLYGLSSFLEVEDPNLDWYDQLPTILPALRNTFLFLSNYIPENSQVYQGEKLEVWISPWTFSIENAKIWPLKEPSLEYLVKNAQPDNTYSYNKLYLSGILAQKVNYIFGNSLHNEVYTDGENTVDLQILPLFPYEGENGFIFPQRNEPYSCTPSDGLINWSP